MVQIKDFTPRLYQQTILATATGKNTLVVLPTGMGKTSISMMLAVHRLNLYPDSKILILAPTKPLAEQHLQTFKRHLDLEGNRFSLFTGLVKPEKRAEFWKDAQIVFSTPQGLENDIISGRIRLEEVSLLVFDEGHRAVGDYAYVFLAEQYNKKSRFPRILALTASPGSDLQKIEDVCKNLFIEGVEVRTDTDPDVKPYIQQIDLEFVMVELPEDFKQIKGFLEDILSTRLKKLKKLGILRRVDVRYVNRTDLLKLQAEIQGRIASGEKNFILWNAASLAAEVMKVQHALELLETQGIATLYTYFKKLEEDGRKTKTKAVRNIVNDNNFRSALIKTSLLKEGNIEHPKLNKLIEIVKKEIKENEKIIVFNQYRDSAVKVQEELEKIEGVRSTIFVGQTKKGMTGFSQKAQIEILNKFRDGIFNILISTSVGEEGLDILGVPLVIFYEPVPSAIRHIQRRGRTGRHEKGRVIVLMTEATRDVGYKWSAYHKEKRMFRNLEKLGNKLNFYRRPEPALNSYTKKEASIKIFADVREKASGVIKELVNGGFDVVLQKLEVGDFLLSSRCGVEFKTKEDFVNSIIDGRLLPQIRGLKDNFERPLLILEGEEDIYSIRNVHPNSIRGMLAAIAVSYGVPIIYSRNPQETASILSIIAKREQEETNRDFPLHGEKREMTLKEWQEYIVASLPGIGAALSKPLLKKFKTIKKIVNAKEDRLQNVEKIGPEKARGIREVLDEEYKD